jgi:uncharacterized membrane protein
MENSKFWWTLIGGVVGVILACLICVFGFLKTLFVITLFIGGCVIGYLLFHVRHIIEKIGKSL